MSNSKSAGKPLKQKMSPQAQAALGTSRACAECHDEKIISNKTYALSKGENSLYGWSTVCRVCQGTQASEKVAPKKSTLRKSFDSDAELVEKLYTLSPIREGAALNQVKEKLTKEIMERPDRESFRLFLQVVQPLIAGWTSPGAIHDDIIDGLLSNEKRVLIVATRYSAKSTLTGIYVTWEIFRNPLIKVLVISRGENLAKRMLRTVRKVFIDNCPLLEHLRPNDDCLDSAEMFQTPAALNVATGGVTLMSLGITSNLPGYRSDLTIADDIEGPQDDTPEKVSALEEKLNELHMINPKGRKIMLGTFQSEFSIYAKLADLQDADGKHVWSEHRALMFVEEEVDGKKVYRSRWPAMFSDKEAMDWRRSVTERAWRLHAMLIADPSLLHERPLKIADFVVVDWDPQAKSFPVSFKHGGFARRDLNTWGAPKGDVWYGASSLSPDKIPYSETVVAIDPASGLAARDAIGVAVLSITPSGYGVIRHLEGVRRGSKADAMRRTAQIIKQFEAGVVIVEELADGLFGETLEGELVVLGHPSVVTKVTTGGQKKGQRIIESLAPPMGAGRLVILEKVATSDYGADFVNQLVRVSYDGRTGRAKDHDDIVDALAHAVAFCKHSLISDVADNIANSSIERLDRWRGVSLRDGGLGHANKSLVMGRGDAKLGDDVPMAERLLEEDETLVKLTARRDALQETVARDIATGRGADRVIVGRIQSLTRQIQQLKEVQVL